MQHALPRAWFIPRRLAWLHHFQMEAKLLEQLMQLAPRMRASSSSGIFSGALLSWRTLAAVRSHAMQNHFTTPAFCTAWTFANLPKAGLGIQRVLALNHAPLPHTGISTVLEELVQQLPASVPPNAAECQAAITEAQPRLLALQVGGEPPPNLDPMPLEARFIYTQLDHTAV